MLTTLEVRDGIKCAAEVCGALFLNAEPASNRMLGDTERLRTLHLALDALIAEARLLRDRLEVLVEAQRLAMEDLARPHRHRAPSLTRANRIF
jgi:hypothetical protein